MTAKLKLVCSEGQMALYRQAQIDAIDAKDASDDSKLAMLRDRHAETGRQISDILWERTRRAYRRKNLVDGKFEMPQLEDAIDE
jgi:hypothetical protein